MEGPASTLCLRTCYIKHCRALGTAGNPPELGQSPLSRSCRCSHRIVKQQRSDRVSKRALPIIPEYPGFQDVKLSKSYLANPAFDQMFQDLERGKKLSGLPRRGSLPHGWGSSSGGCLRCHQPTSPGFQDKPLQESFSERLMELGSHESTGCGRRCRGFAERSRSPSLALRGCRSGCGAARALGREGEQPCSPAQQHSRRGMESKAQQEIHSILKVYSGDFLELLTVPIAAPLAALVQEK